MDILAVIGVITGAATIVTIWRVSQSLSLRHLLIVARATRSPRACVGFIKFCTEERRPSSPEMTGERADHHLEQIIASACCVVGADEEVGSITVVANRRLTYHELARMRDHAALCRVAIAMTGDGTVTVRRHSARRTSPSVGRFGGENEHGSGDSSAHGAC